MDDSIPQKALSVRQPWAWLVVNGFKDIENRTRRTKFWGRFFVHASLTIDVEFDRLLQRWAFGADDPTGFLTLNSPQARLLAERYNAVGGAAALPRGGILGEAEITDCVDASDSPWFRGPFGYLLANAGPCPFIPCRGMLGFFVPKVGE